MEKQQPTDQPTYQPSAILLRQSPNTGFISRGQMHLHEALRQAAGKSDREQRAQQEGSKLLQDGDTFVMRSRHRKDSL